MNVYSEERPWGKFEKFHENKPCTVKLLYARPNSRSSLQYHSSRTEVWKVIKGIAFVQLGNEDVVLKEGDMLTIPRKARHRLGTLEAGCVVLEIAYGEFDEKDKVRISDDYGREASINAISRPRASAAN